MYIKKMIGSKCYLSPIKTEDAEKYAMWINDEEVSDNLTMSSMSLSAETEYEILQRISKEHNYGIIDLQTDSLIGSTGLSGIDYIHRSANLGIFIGNKEFWNKGYGVEALSLLINYAYKKLNLHNLSLNVYSFNKRAIACYTKIGFKKAGVIRQSIIRNLEYHDTILMDILPEEFYKLNPQYK